MGAGTFPLRISIKNNNQVRFLIFYMDVLLEFAHKMGGYKIKSTRWTDQPKG